MLLLYDRGEGMRMICVVSLLEREIEIGEV